MYICPLSDLHIEFQKDKGYGLAKEIVQTLPSETILILAGDTGNLVNLDTMYDFVDILDRHFDSILMICGNHEYYGTTIPGGNKLFKDLQLSLKNTSCMNNDKVTINDIDFLGCTLWFDDPPTPHDVVVFYQCMSDATVIKKSHADMPVIAQIIDEHRKSFSFLQENVTNKSIVISHHLPTTKSIGRHWVGNPSNPFFYSGDKVEYLISKKQPTHWFHGHCIDEKSEILTNDGWMTHDGIKEGQTVYSLNRITGKFEEDSVLAIHKFPEYQGGIYEFNNRKNVDFSVTANHNMIAYNATKTKIIYENAETFLNRGSCHFIRSGILPRPGMGLPDRMLELYFAIAADGGLYNTNLIRFSFHKEKKIKYITELLQYLNIPFRLLQQSKDKSRFNINFTLPECLNNLNIKGLDNKLFGMNRSDCKELLKAYQNTDGNINHNTTVIYTSKSEEKDLIQAILTLNGFCCVVSSRIHGFGKKLSHQLSISDKQTNSCNFNISKKDIKYQVVDKMFVWCITTKNGNFFMRRNGKVMLTGNTHDSFDYMFGETRVICNPGGYYISNKKFDVSKIIEI